MEVSWDAVLGQLRSAAQYKGVAQLQSQLQTILDAPLLFRDAA